MNKITVAIATLCTVGIGSLVNFFILRTVLRKLNKPYDTRQQTVVAAILTALLAVPSIIRTRQFEVVAESELAQR